LVTVANKTVGAICVGWVGVAKSAITDASNRGEMSLVRRGVGRNWLQNKIVDGDKELG